MNRIISKKNLSEDLIRFEISTSHPVKEIQPGQYMVFRIERNRPGIPLPIVKTNAEKGTVFVMVSARDENTGQLALLNAGTTFSAIDGPYGYGAKIEHFGTVLCIGCGGGIIALLPVLLALKGAGNRIITILSAPSGKEIILENEIKAICDELTILTDDESYGEKGSICSVAVQALRSKPVKEVFVFGGAKAIRETCLLTTKYQVHTQAVLYLEQALRNGAHGIFKVSICANVRSICVDGFDFNAYYPNFDELVKRFDPTEGELISSVNGLEKANIAD